MGDVWKPSEKETNLIYSFALQNVLEYGQAQMGSIMGKLSQNFDMRAYGKLLPRYVISQVNRANSILQKEGEEAVRNELISIDATKIERLDREKVKIERTFPELSNVKEGNFRVRFAPNPNAPLTVGHMRGVLINNYYANKYGGDFILRFDDTSTDVKPPILDAYVQILKDAYWLTGKAPDDVIIASDRMDIYYDYANQLISLNGAYMCDCKNFKELKDASEPCPHRELSIDENLDLFNKMVAGEFPAGKWVLRAKTDLNAPNPAFRDFVLFRVQKNAHPRTGDSYKAWPMLDFQSAIDDHLIDITHVIRGIDLQDSTAKQKILYDVFDWEYPETIYWGRVKILDQDDNEVKFSSSQYAKDIAEGKFTGWDDERLYTVQAFKKRGYTPDALLEWWLEYGLTRKPITVSMKTLDTLQRRKKEMSAEEYEFFEIHDMTKEELEIINKINSKELTMCESCDTIFPYVPQKIFCDMCNIRKQRERRANMTDEDKEKRNRKERERRANMTDEEREEYRRKHRERRANMTDEEREEYRRKGRERDRKRWANMTDEEREEYRRKDRERLANRTEEEKEEYRRKGRDYARKRRANRTDEEREESKRKSSERWANRTDEEREESKRKRREKDRERRANMTDEEREEYNRKKREGWANMTDEEREERNRKQREYDREGWANMTDEKRKEYNRKRRERRARKREMGAEEGGIEYKYALVAKYPDIELQDFNIPEGLEVIGKNHITIVSGKALKPVKKIVKENKDNLSLLPLPPKPIMGKTGVAIRDIEGEERETYFMEIGNQDEFQDYANLVCASLGIENPEPERFFHLSIANNQGGDSFKSVGDIKLEDLGGEN